MRWFSVVSFVCCACAPTLHLSRPTKPRASLGGAQSLSITVKSGVPTFSSAALTSLSVGGVVTSTPIPTVVQERFKARLSGLGFDLCTEGCDAAMTVTLTEVDVGPDTSTGVGSGIGGGTSVQVHCRLSARVTAIDRAGATLFDEAVRDVRVGPVEDSNGVVKESADMLAGRVQATLEPGRERWKLPLLDDVDTAPGVQLLEARDWKAATRFFEDLTARRPELDAAWYDLGVAWEAQLDFDKAVAAYEEANRRAPSSRYAEAIAGAKARGVSASD